MTSSTSPSYVVGLSNINSALEKTSKNKWNSQRDFLVDYACKIAADTIHDYKLTEEDTSSILKEIISIFDIWQEEHGVYPPKKQNSNILGMVIGLESTQISAKDYIDKLLESDDEADLPNAWECCDYVNTPVGLFFRLFIEEYQPLDEYLDKDFVRNYSATLAILILITASKEIIYRNECVNAAFKLARLRIKDLNHKVKNMEPHTLHILNMQQQAQISRKEKQKEREQAVLSVYDELCENGNVPSALQKIISNRTKIPQQTVSTILMRHGKSKKSKRKSDNQVVSTHD